MKVVNIVATLSVFFLSACDPLTIALGGVAVAGTTAVRNQNGLSGSLSDNEIQVKINKIFFDNDKDIFDRTELSVKHGAVIVIGYMKDKNQCEKAIRLAKQVGDSVVIFDETKIQEEPKAKNLAIDSSITSRIKSDLAFDGNVKSLNYDITTVNGVVYICGTAQNRYERDIVLHSARTTSGVINVIAYIRLNDASNRETKV